MTVLAPPARRDSTSWLALNAGQVGSWAVPGRLLVTNDPQYAVMSRANCCSLASNVAAIGVPLSKLGQR